MSNGLSRRLSRVAQSVPTIERSPEYSDDAIALKVAERFEGDFLYVASWKQWLRWDGHRYRVDDTLKVFDSVRGVARSIANGCNDPRQAKAIAGATTIAGVERLARSDPRLSASAFEFDVDPMKMNTPDGIVDLETGACQPSRREDRVTKLTAAGLGDHCPRWRQFLREITDGDDELQSYLARVFGYALTGSVRENAFFFCYGLGANGKTVLIETMAKVLGDYALPAPIEMFTLGPATPLLPESMMQTTSQLIDDIRHRGRERDIVAKLRAFGLSPEQRAKLSALFTIIIMPVRPPAFIQEIEKR